MVKGWYPEYTVTDDGEIPVMVIFPVEVDDDVVVVVETAEPWRTRKPFAYVPTYPFWLVTSTSHEPTLALEGMAKVQVISFMETTETAVAGTEVLPDFTSRTVAPLIKL